MASNSKKLVSPQAQSKWICIDKPHPEYDVFQITLILPTKSKEAKKWMSEIDGWISDEIKFAGSKGASEYPPYKEDGDNTLFKFKQKPVFKSKDGTERAVKIIVIDAKMKPCKVDIGWGSTVKVAYSPVPYTVNGKSGVTLYFNAVQVIELVEYDSMQGSGFIEEEGYEASEEIGSSNEANPFLDVQEGEEVDVKEEEEEDNEDDF